MLLTLPFRVSGLGDFHSEAAELSLQLGLQRRDRELPALFRLPGSKTFWCVVLRVPGGSLRSVTEASLDVGGLDGQALLCL
jgi:hypothetical protein